jgi:formate dehydrogenase iron-sulfur subunit
MKAAILTDVTKCTGCMECVIACKKQNDLGPDFPRRWHRNDGLSARNWTSIIEKPESHYVRKQCRHCLEAACVSVCPVAALTKTAEGPVIYDPDICMGCRYCMVACPYGIPRYDWDKPAAYIQKCNMCIDRIRQGQQPACTEACPYQATIFGDRDQLLDEAHKRIEQHPDKYIDHVYGEFEVGGSSVLYISDIDLGFLSYPQKPGITPLPETTKTAMGAVPLTFAGMGVLMGGLYWICQRRAKLQGSKNKEDQE